MISALDSTPRSQVLRHSAGSQYWISTLDLNTGKAVRDLGTGSPVLDLSAGSQIWTPVLDPNAGFHDWISALGPRYWISELDPSAGFQSWLPTHDLSIGSQYLALDLSTWPQYRACQAGPQACISALESWTGPAGPPRGPRRSRPSAPDQTPLRPRVRQVEGLHHRCRETKSLAQGFRCLSTSGQFPYNLGRFSGRTQR